MARRVNTKFLIILTVGVVGLGTVGLIAAKFLPKGKPEKFTEIGNKLMSEKKYSDALKSYMLAANLDDRNPQRWVDCGDAYYQMSATEVENLNKAQLFWGRALELDPKFKPALTRLLSYQVAVLELDPRPKSFDQVRATAQRLLESDPNDTTATIALYGTQIRSWLYGVETDAARIDAAVAKLLEVAKKDPTNSDAPFWAAQAKVRMALNPATAGAAATQPAVKFDAQAIAIIDEALKQQDTAVMHFRAAQVLLLLEQTNKAYKERRAQELQKARALAKPADELYGEIFRISAEAALMDNNRDEAEKISQERLKQRPNDPDARLGHAKLLARFTTTKREEAMKLLEEKIDPELTPGISALRRGSLALETLNFLAELRLDQYPQATTAQKAAMLPEIEKGIEMLASKVGEAPATLALRGKLYFVQGKYFEAIPMLKKALGVSEGNANLNSQVMFVLGRAYVETRQTGQARTQFAEVLKIQPAFVPARVMLAQLLVQERDFSAAEPHIVVLLRAFPEEPEILRLRMMSLDPVAKKDEILKYYAKLPETTARDKTEKARLASGWLQNKDEAIRLLTSVLAADAADLAAVQQLVQLYLRAGDRIAALQVVVNAEKANPKETMLADVRRAIEDTKTNEPVDINKKLAENVKDPFTRQLLLADVAHNTNDNPKQLEYLKAAEKISPDNITVKQQLFNCYFAMRDFGEAEKYLPALTAANADKADGSIYRFRLAMARGEYTNAMAAAQALIDKYPDFAQSWVCMGQVLQAGRQFEDALNRFVGARDRQSENPEAMRGMIECSYALNRPADAQRYINEGLRTLPTNAYLREARINHELSYGDSQIAIKARQEAVTAAPADAANWIRLGAVYLAAARKSANPDDPAAIDLLRKAQDTYSQGMAKWPDEPRFVSMFAEISLLLKAPDAGEAAIKKLLARDAFKSKPEATILLAEFYIRAARSEDARAILQQLVTKYPANVDLQLAYVSLLTDMGKTDDALAALNVNPDDSRVLYQRVQYLISLNRLEDAEKNLAPALAKNSNSSDLFALSGYVNLSRGKIAEGEANLKQALEINSKNNAALHFMAMLRMRQQLPDYDEAIRYLTTLRDLAPGNMDARLTMASAFRQKNDVTGAVRELESAIQMAPADKRVRLSLISSYIGFNPPRWPEVERVINASLQMPQFKNDPEFLQAAASMWEERGDIAKAGEYVSRAIQAAPDNPALLRQYLQLMIKARDFKRVIDTADRILAAGAKPWWAYEARAIAMRWLDKKDQSIEDFDAALSGASAEGLADYVVQSMVRELGAEFVLTKILPRTVDDNRWRLMAANLYQIKKDYANATAMFEKVMAEFDKLPLEMKKGALRFGGVLYLTSEPPQPERSYDAYLKLLELAPGDLPALNNLACLLAEPLNRPGEALKYSQKAYELIQRMNVKQPAIVDTHAWVLILNGRVDEGIDLLRQVVDSTPILDAHYHLAEAYKRKAILGEAERQWQQADKMLQTANAKKEAVDPILRKKIDDLGAQLREMTKVKPQATAQ